MFCFTSRAAATHPGWVQQTPTYWEQYCPQVSLRANNTKKQNIYVVDIWGVNKRYLVLRANLKGSALNFPIV